MKGPADQQYADHLNEIIKELSRELYRPNALPVTKMNQPTKIKPEFKPVPLPSIATINNYTNINNVGADDCAIIDNPQKRKIEDEFRSSDRYFVIPDDENAKGDEDDSFYFHKRKKQKNI